MTKPKEIIVNPPEPDKKGRGRPKKVLDFNSDKTMSNTERNKIKKEIIATIESGEARTPTGACDLLGYPSGVIQKWLRDDRAFFDAARMARKVFGERTIEEIADNPNIIGKIFLVKGIFPEFRDNYHTNLKDSKLDALLNKLIELGKKSTTITVEPPKVTTTLELPPGLNIGDKDAQ